ncbi:Hpt domain-containing protein [Jiella sp. MQZ9-1]|uniref:Hpt domain-containing protein n=1 Tax=Jiella flava TaxID=2816857 RepID=A0A939FYC5_9HYPH|nr:Hpt domain-containing protein [Jiella flava]MBO0662263.1 Hpt domain-containing protein [Jiella flava]MCD2470906.1 Hpt domain-containing protein [Jiella flava]
MKSVWSLFEVMTTNQSKADLMTARLLVLTDKFRASAVSDMERIRQVFDASVSGEASAADRDEICRIGHSLAGRAGTFGFPKISSAAAALEDLIRAGGRDLAPTIGRLADAIGGELAGEHSTTN